MKNTCLEIFGEFIYYLKKEDLEKNKQMINVYVNETLEINISLENNLTLIYNIAYSFPSVLITLKEKISNEIWDEIKIVYFYFFNVNDFKVKLTISSSFKEISKIIGSDKIKLLEVIKVKKILRLKFYYCLKKMGMILKIILFIIFLNIY